jgi:hypothetical protein
VLQRQQRPGLTGDVQVGAESLREQVVCRLDVVDAGGRAVLNWLARQRSAA